MSVDITKPSTSRIYDYVLGGHHNFEIDRIAAQQILKVFPSYPRWARLNRWFLQMVAERWAAEGYRHVLDLGSGMPTQGHFHTAMPGAKVLYTDIDPMTVAYAKEVLGDSSSVVYEQTDLREPSPMLQAADRLFGGERKVAVGCIGISYFLDDAAMQRLAGALHAWAGTGSVMALSFVDGAMRTENNRQTSDLFKRNGSELFMRDEAAVRQVIAPWQIHTIKPLSTWLDMDDAMLESDRENADAEMYGVLLVRED
jgi:O-methyltransferase involved in polyketide biosynthesis